MTLRLKKNQIFTHTSPCIPQGPIIPIKYCRSEHADCRTGKEEDEDEAAALDQWLDCSQRSLGGILKPQMLSAAQGKKMLLSLKFPPFTALALSWLNGDFLFSLLNANRFIAPGASKGCGLPFPLAPVH